MINNLLQDVSKSYLDKQIIREPRNVGKLSYLLTDTASFIIKIFNLYIDINLPLDRSYYILYTQSDSDTNMKLSKFKRVNLLYYYDNKLSLSIVK